MVSKLKYILQYDIFYCIFDQINAAMVNVVNPKLSNFLTFKYLSISSICVSKAANVVRMNHSNTNCHSITLIPWLKHTG